MKDSQVSVSVVYLVRNAFSECSTCVPYYTSQSYMIDAYIYQTTDNINGHELNAHIYFFMSLYVARFDLSVTHLIS